MSNNHMFAKLIFGCACVVMPTSALLSQTIALRSDIFVETYSTGKDGAIERQLRPATTVVPGDRLVYVLSYHNNGARPADNFALTNPLPAAVEFAGDESAGAEMSIDGGRNFAPLARLTVRNADGTMRPAQRVDVTHIRWTFANAIPPAGSGEVTFKAKLK